MQGYAPGWRVRCTKCQETRDAASIGMVRVGAWSRKKYTFGWCSNCRRYRFIAIERSPEPIAKPAKLDEIG